ncbi:hypothetical protein ABZ614_39920 [Streptomyces sp. NPDC013178]|uniref:hypothetical protein n=1 Tax=Streptomyces sp. NPDC013178 TaxID=3155118 RepID=UPI0033E64426
MAELSGLIDLVPPESKDPRLPDGVPDSKHKPAHWLNKDGGVDAVFRLPHGVRVDHEYDGAFHDSARQRDHRRYENDKSRVLVEAGNLNPLIHVRIGHLPVVEAPHALVVAVPERATTYQQARAVASALSARFAAGAKGEEEPNPLMGHRSEEQRAEPWSTRQTSRADGRVGLPRGLPEEL